MKLWFIKFFPALMVDVYGNAIRNTSGFFKKLRHHLFYSEKQQPVGRQKLTSHVSLVRMCLPVHEGCESWNMEDLTE